MKFPIVTLCGSTRFKDDFYAVAKSLTLQGKIVLMPMAFEKADNEELPAQAQSVLCDMHFANIDMSESIFVINKGGYIGEQTQKEIEYAMHNNKRVQYLER